MKTIELHSCRKVTALEEFLLSYCERRQLSVRGTEHVIQAVTTQMSFLSQENRSRNVPGLVEEEHRGCANGAQQMFRPVFQTKMVLWPPAA